MVAYRSVHVCGVPVDLAQASENHLEGTLAAAERAIAAGGPGLSASLALTVRSLTEEYSDLATSTRTTIDAAADEGRATTDLEFEAPLTLASAAETWLRLLEHLDDLAASGEFEHPTTPDDVQAYRRWLIREVVDQLREGRPPVAFSEATV